MAVVTIDPSLLPESLVDRRKHENDHVLVSAQELIDLHIEISQKKGLVELSEGRRKVEEIMRGVQEKL